MLWTSQRWNTVINSSCHVSEACVAIYYGPAHVRKKTTQTAFSQIIVVYEKSLCCEIYTAYEHDIDCHESLRNVQ